MKKLFSILLTGALACLPAAAQTSTKLTATKANEYGLMYTLPLTAFEVTIAVEKTVNTPGDFYQYARKYLNTDPILKPSTSWRIKEAVVNPVAVADENERYLANFKGGVGTFMMLSDENFPLSVNDEDYDAEITFTELPKAVPAEPTVLQRPVAQQAMTPEMIQSKSSAKRAELAADKIYELRTNRNEIISGQAEAMPSDGAAMKLALDQLTAQEEALTAMFLGTVQKSVEVRTYTVYLPDDPAGGREIVARLSPVDGLVDSKDLSGDPIYITITPTTRGEIPVNEKGVAKSFPKGGVAYRIPGAARVKLSFDDRTLTEKEFDVAQYGVVFGLDPGLFTNKKAPAYLHYNPLTGGVRELGTLEK
ncbi:MAG: DUF4831 family protein [Staphylococcus sp.]|nr:DUF4831 family protein [Staphylococcus sp.]